MKTILVTSLLLIFCKANCQNNIIIENSSLNGVSAKINIPPVQFIDVYDSTGAVYQLLDFKNCSEIEPFSPKVPIIAFTILIPNGKELNFSVDTNNSLIFDNINLIPQHSLFFDSSSSNQPFKKNDDIYSMNQNFPGDFIKINTIGEMRGQRIAQILLYPYQYNPVIHKLKVYPNLRVTLQFTGAYSRPLTKNYHSVFYKYLKSLTINADEVLIDEDSLSVQRKSVSASKTTGCDYIIIAYDDFESAANKLADWKNSIGINTLVFTTSEIAIDYNNLDEVGRRTIIKSFINETENWDISPIYMLFFGDADLIPTWTHIWPHTKDAPGEDEDPLYNSTDFFYAEYRASYPSSSHYYNSDWESDLFYGRIPVRITSYSDCSQTDDHLLRADNIVSKIIDYERKNFTSGFYNRIAVGGAFYYDASCPYSESNPCREERRYIKTLEETLKHLTAYHNYTCERIYSWHPGPQYQNYPNTYRPSDWTKAGVFQFENDPIASCNTNNSINNEIMYPNFDWVNNIDPGLCNLSDGSINKYKDLFENANKVPFLFIYYGHGGCSETSPLDASSTWGSPYFRFNNDWESMGSGGSNIRNQMPPVIWSISCVNGLFQENGNCLFYNESLAESWINKTDLGAAGVIASTAVSGSVFNARLIWGMMDAIWPDFIETTTNNIASYGGNEPILEMGIILKSGQDYIKDKYPHLEFEAFRHREKYHYFGDPSMRIIPFTCKQELELSNITVLDNETRVPDVSTGFIRVSENGPFIIEGNGITGGDCNFTAGKSIVFKPGFHAESGSHIIAIIDPCEEEIPFFSNKNIFTEYLHDYNNTGNNKKTTFGIKDITIIPNPSNGEFEVKLQYLFSGDTEIELYDIYGKIVYHAIQQSSNFTVKTINCNPGIYFIRVSAENDIFSKTLIFE
jgi:hypothetical protein